MSSVSAILCPQVMVFPQTGYISARSGVNSSPSHARQKNSRHVWIFCAILSQYNGAIEHKGQIRAKSVKGRWQRANKSSEKRQSESEG